jgi:hypothetical protein
MRCGSVGLRVSSHVSNVLFLNYDVQMAAGGPSHEGRVRPAADGVWGVVADEGVYFLRVNSRLTT